MTRKAPQAALPRGRRPTMIQCSGISSRAARATRASTMVSGGSSRTATPAKKNEPPQSTERRTSSAQSRASIAVSVLAAMCGPSCRPPVGRQGAPSTRNRCAAPRAIASGDAPARRIVASFAGLT